MSEPAKTTRRQFLKGQPVTDSLLKDGAAGTADEDSTADSASVAPPSYLMHVQRRAMACDFAVFFNAGQHDQAAERALETLELVDVLEDQMTVYRDHSEVCGINRRAADAAVAVEPQLFELLQLAVHLHDETDGAFDITSGPLTKTWGFYRREGKVPTKAALQTTMRSVGSKWLDLNEQDKTVKFLTSGVEINLGGIGKGYALDRCVDYLLSHGIDDFLLHGGQSSIVARGSRSQDEGWPVGIRHPLRPERRLAEIHLRNRAMGTSGTGRQSFHHQGRRYGHILDPRTGWPVEGVLSCTALAPSAAMADALATAFYVSGVEKARAYCQARDDLGVVIVAAGSKRGSVEVHSYGLAKEELQLLDNSQ